MSSFASSWWNITIIVLTLGGLGGLWWLTAATARIKPPSEEDEAPSAEVDDSSGETSSDTTGHVWDDDLRELNNPLPRWWVNMFYITLAFAAIYLAFYPGLGLNAMFLGWTQTGQYEREMAAAERSYGPLFEAFASRPIEDLASDTEALKVGRRLFSNYCATCHGSDARGSPGFPNLADDNWQYAGEPEAIKTSILDGRIAAMPPWETALGGEDGVNAMTHYVRGLSGLAHDRELAAQAEPQYKQLCVACHGANGQGNPVLGASNLADDVWLYGGSHDVVAASIARGRNGVMPPHRDFLGEAKAHLLAAYVFALSKR